MVLYLFRKRYNVVSRSSLVNILLAIMFSEYIYSSYMINNQGNYMDIGLARVSLTQLNSELTKLNGDLEFIRKTWNRINWEFSIGDEKIRSQQFDEIDGRVREISLFIPKIEIHIVNIKRFDREIAAVAKSVYKSLKQFRKPSRNDSLRGFLTDKEVSILVLCNKVGLVFDELRAIVRQTQAVLKDKEHIYEKRALLGDLVSKCINRASAATKLISDLFTLEAETEQLLKKE